jgi:hypothetical protein
MAGTSKRTTDHETIRKWAETRGAKPATVKGTGGGQNETGVLRMNFPGYGGERLEEISWDEFFRKFDEKGLEFLYQEQTRGGEQSNFFKLVRRSGQERKAA